VLLTEEDKVQAATTLWPVSKSGAELLQTCAAALPAANQPANWESQRVKAHSGTQAWLTAGIQTSWQQLPFPLKRKAPV